MNEEQDNYFIKLMGRLKNSEGSVEIPKTLNTEEFIDFINSLDMEDKDV